MDKRGMVRAARWLGVAACILMLAAIRPRFARFWICWTATHRGESRDLAGADLHEADLSRVSLKRANLRGACLVKAKLFETDCRGADLRGANMQDALMAGADLRWARLDGVRMNGAVYDKSTHWPTGFTPTKHGATPAQWDASVWHAFGRPDSPGGH
jgi:Pentapeptide repeats (8 copies)